MRRVLFALHRGLLRTAGLRFLRPAWALAYRGVARAAVAWLTRGEPGAAAYLRGGVAVGDFVPALSDVDLTLVLADRDGAERVRRRWARLARVPLAGDFVVDVPRIYADAELRALRGASALTAGVDCVGDEVDRMRALLRPGLYGDTADWHRLSGPDRRPAEPPRDVHARLVAAWLELAYWWRWAFHLCRDPSGPRTAYMCVKLVAEPARVWLWLAHAQQVGPREELLRQAIRRLPEEEAVLRPALELHARLALSPPPPLAEAIAGLVRLSARIAARVGAEAAALGSTAVELLPGELTPPAARADRRLPLADWRALASPLAPDESFAPRPGDPSDPARLAALAAWPTDGPHPTLRTGDLLVLPGPTRHARTRLRAVQCPATDPVSFALLEGRSTAEFPAVRGWSAADAAERAVGSHRAWLTAREPPGRALGRLFTAARAALFHQSLRQGDPRLALTAAATARALPAGSAVDRALDAYRVYRERAVDPSPETVEAMRRVVGALPAYGDPQPAPVRPG